MSHAICTRFGCPGVEIRSGGIAFDMHDVHTHK